MEVKLPGKLPGIMGSCNIAASGKTPSIHRAPCGSNRPSPSSGDSSVSGMDSRLMEVKLAGIEA